MNDDLATDVESPQNDVPAEGRKTFPMIDRIAELICTSENYWVSRERLVREILRDNEGMDFVSQGLSRHPEQTELEYAEQKDLVLNQSSFQVAMKTTKTWETESFTPVLEELNRKRGDKSATKP